MCNYATIHCQVEGSAKGPAGEWSRITEGTVYFDHPVHAMAEHTLNIDLSAPQGGAGARIALELTAASARSLVEAIEAALTAGGIETTVTVDSTLSTAYSNCDGRHGRRL